MEAPVKPEKDGRALEFLYSHATGRIVLRILCSRSLSRAAGKFLDSRFSRVLIGPFARHFGISLEECKKRDFYCFNDFFCRELKDGARPVDMAGDSLIAPCDGLMSAYRIRRDTVFPVKQSRYTVKSLLAQDALHREFQDGICLVFRLCVNHYHRYCYIDDGVKGENHFVSGRLHTVRPVALKKVPVFVENSREYTVIDTDHFGKVVQMEVGAMLVGKILNYHGAGRVRRGREKGRFMYGGSTVIILLKKDAARLPQSVFSQTAAGMEIPVKMGERIGTAVQD